jgi:hypothetical protein
VECLAEETEVLGDNLPQFRVAHHKFRMAWARVRTRAAAVAVESRLSYGTADRYVT